jgi:hypothetical protein
MAIFDQAARFLIKLDPAGFLRWLAPAIEKVLVFTRWCDTQTIPFPGEANRRCDTVAELASISGSGPPWLLVLEVQTRPDPDITERLLEYLARLRVEIRHGPHGRDKYPIAAGVLNLTGTTTGDVIEMLLPGDTGIGLHWRLLRRNLAAESAPALLQAVASGEQAGCLLPWIPLMASGDQPEVVTRWKELAGQEPSSRRRGQYGGLALVFANLVAALDIWKQGLEGWNVEECEIVLEWQEQGRQKGLRQGREEGRQEGLLQGRQEGLLLGRETGQQEGLSQGLQIAVLLTLEQRFATPLPADLVARIEAQTDMEQLRRWQALAVTVESLEQLLAAFGP